MENGLGEIVGVYWGFLYKGKKSRCKGDLFLVFY